MTKPFCPAYPRPLSDKASLWGLFTKSRYSWLHSLSERSYRMQMGEVHLPGADLYMVNDPAEVKRMLTDEAAQFPKSTLLHEALHPLLGESIFTTNGEQWQRQRAMMDPAFAQARLPVSFPVMREAADDMLARMLSRPDGHVQDIDLEMTHVTADIIFRTIFSVPLQAEEARRVFDAFAEYQALVPKLMLPVLYRLRWLAWPWEHWRARRAARSIRLLLETLIRPRFEAHQRGEASDSMDILQSLLTARDPVSGLPFSFQELVDQVAMLFLAGHETSASALTWAAHLLAHSPDVQARMHQQVRGLLRGRTMEQSDIKQLSLAANVFKETLRLFPPVGFFAREARQSCPIRDKQVAAGSTVVVSPWLIHRHRQFWSDPDAFDPDRYERDVAASRASLQRAYLPFSMGPRVCLGAAFAMQEGVLILSALVNQFHLEPAAGPEPVPVGRLTIRSDNGVRLRLWRRVPS